MSKPPPTYSIETGIATRDFGVLWPVAQHHRSCGCGAHKMQRIIGYFTSKEDAEAYISMVTYLESQAANPDGTRRV